MSATDRGGLDGAMARFYDRTDREPEPEPVDLDAVAVAMDRYRHHPGEVTDPREVQAIEARMRYARLPWWKRLITRAPEGWHSGRARTVT